MKMNSWSAPDDCHPQIYLCWIQAAWISLHDKGCSGHFPDSHWERNPRQYCFSQPLHLPELLSLWTQDKNILLEVTSQDCLDLLFYSSWPKTLPWRHWQRVLFPPLRPVVLPTFLFPADCTERKGRNNLKTYEVPQSIYPWTCWEQTTFLSFNSVCSVSSVLDHFCWALGNLWACDQGKCLCTRLIRNTVLFGRRVFREEWRKGSCELLLPTCPVSYDGWWSLIPASL